ncbi:MAG: glycosyl hydrolase 108 family protein [Hyphomonadaceae bacterium]
MAKQNRGDSDSFRLVPLGDQGAAFQPGQDYFSVALVSVHLPGKLLNTSKFAPVIWASMKHFSLNGERTLIGLFPSNSETRPEFARNDRLEVMDLQLTPRVISQEEMTVELTLGVVKEKDYISGVLKLVCDIASTPAAAFLSQITPIAGAAGDVAQSAQTVKDSLDDLLDSNKLQSLGRFVGTLRSPVRSGDFAFVNGREDEAALRFDATSRQLVSKNGPVKSAYIVLRLQREEYRPDWMVLPDLNQAWLRIRESALAGGDVREALNLFRITALTSPDITRTDANRIVEAAEQRFAPILEGAESALIGDPGGMAEALSFFMDSPEEETGAESFMLGGVAASTALSAIGMAPFRRCLSVVLENEGGFVDHPNDPGGATNKGVTQKTYDAYRTRKGLPKRTVRDLEQEELEEIYFQGYWRTAHCADLPNEALSLFVFDAAVNHGTKNAIRMLQQASGLPAVQCDGAWGKITRAKVIAAASNTTALIAECLAKREGFYRRLVETNPKLGVFLRGWLNRLVHLKKRMDPLIRNAPGVGETESLLLEDDGGRAPLAAAPPDFDGWTPNGAASQAAG